MAGFGDYRSVANVVLDQSEFIFVALVWLSLPFLAILKAVARQNLRRALSSKSTKLLQLSWQTRCIVFKARGSFQHGAQYVLIFSLQLFHCAKIFQANIS
jgi:hypothetical protein